MIQRIQTVWLLLASVTILALFLFPYAQFSDNSGIAMALKVTGVLNHAGGQNQSSTSFAFVLQSIATILLAILPFITVLKYKNRRKQISLILISLLLVILFAFWLFISANTAVEAVNKTIELNNIGIGALLILPYIVFLLLAMRGINHDTKLIKSADRLR
ncbi:DUF4293 domain-containing protein [Olivibacter sp. XZL3]|uniref:DUF4293 domain-containing protein n=1 Tax=Olivibacter sp. XZL3 TaxID=1735116 RepID=UPI001066F151|nr:DUF4293 domain-containing protein [Olivibacter sp. XZL3]